MKATFDVLLESVSSGDLDKFQAKRETLSADKTKLQEKLTKVNQEIAAIDAQIAAPLRNAIKAAQLLGVEVPEKYQAVKVNGAGNGNRSMGKFYWESVGAMPFQAEVSRAMWRLSQGSGGSAGKKGEGVLNAAEFWAIAKLDEAKLKLGDKHSVTLPNGKVVTFQKTEE